MSVDGTSAGGEKAHVTLGPGRLRLRASAAVGTGA